MGKRGPQPMPMAQVEKDSSPSTQSRRKNAARHTPKIPECPPELSDRAKDEWNRITKELDKIGIISVLDTAVLAEYCSAWATWLDMMEYLNQCGEWVFTTTTGYQQQKPEVGILHKAADRMMKAGATLGLNPSARSGINVGGDNDGQSLFD
jgi:P27 family predicted phage terminase small subunit